MLDDVPVWGGEQQDGERSALHVLLMRKSLIARNQDVKGFTFAQG
jgi:hypothetical protein